jgi:hypothetical protein
MKRMKKLVAIVLMAMVLGVGAPAAFADGPVETPGVTTSGPVETPGVTTAGPVETPGQTLIDILVLLATNLVA